MILPADVIIYGWLEMKGYQIIYIFSLKYNKMSKIQFKTTLKDIFPKYT